MLDRDCCQCFSGRAPPRLEDGHFRTIASRRQSLRDRQSKVKGKRMYFLDRVDAGRTLAALLHSRGFGDMETVVVGLPRGGVPVAYEVADALSAPLDVILVQKLGVPFQPELAMGAIGEGGVRIRNENVMSMTGMRSEDLAAVERRERAELERRAQRFRAVRPRIPLTGRTALIVDDGIATGSTARAACQVARAHGAVRVVLATPVASPSTLHELRHDADDVICVREAEPLWAVGQFYADFAQTSDAEVIDLLQKAAAREEERVREGDNLDSTQWDPSLGRAREEAQGLELYEDPLRYRSRLVEREGAQGVEVFADPDAAVPATVSVEGSPGHETLTGDQAGLEPNDEDRRYGPD
jgi:putative phosphoribosyl transferase